MNPSGPTIRRLIKIHKKDQPNRTVVNGCNASAYLLSKLFTNKINRLSLNYAFNIRNTHDLVQKFNDIPMLPHYTLAPLDITNLYSNIPVTKIILTNMLKQELVDSQT